jgi:hypothetical protein
VNLINFLSELALNHSPPDLCLPSSWDYRLAFYLTFWYEVITVEEDTVIEEFFIVEEEVQFLDCF